MSFLDATPELGNLAARLGIPQARAEARILILSGDHWGPWLDLAIRRACRSIHLSVYLVSHHWRPRRKGDLDLLGGLAAAAQRGVTCRAILGNPAPGAGGQHYNRDAARRLHGAGWGLRLFQGPRVLHEKYWLIDRQLCVVGSHNLSRAAAAANWDTSLAIDAPAVADLLWRQFWGRWRDAAPYPQA